MKTILRPAFVLALGALAACGESSEQAPAPVAVQTPTQTPTQTPAQAPATTPTQPEAQTVPLPPTPGVAVKLALEPASAAELRKGERTPAEVATPWALPESERSCPSPFRPDVALELPLSVAGEAIPADEIKRHLCLGVGQAYADYHKFQILIADEIERRKQAGEDVSRFEISEQDIDAYIENQRQEFAKRYPTLDFPIEVGRAYISYDLYRAPAAQLLVFNRLFLPENPTEWPELTKELIRAWGGDLFIDDAVQSYERRKQAMIDQGLDEIPPDDPIIVQTWRDIVLQGLNEFAQIETSPAKLPEGVLMTVDGRPITIEQVWSMIGPYVSQSELDFTRRFLVLCRLLERDLAAKQVLLSQEEFEQAWPQPEGVTYRQKLSQHAMLAPQMIGMSSMEAYALYNRLLESLRRELGEQLEDDALLREWSSATNEVTGASKRDVEMMLCSAWDGDTVAWKEDGWAKARQKAFQLAAELRAGADWKTLLELHSEFWDPPMPEDGPKPMFSFRYKGALGQQTHNQLLGIVEESEGHAFVYGDTLTHEVFYEQTVGTIVGPRMGSRGYYLLRVTGRTPPVRPLDLSVPLHRQLIQNYYLRTQLNQRAHELLAAGIEAGTVQGV